MTQTLTPAPVETEEDADYEENFPSLSSLEKWKWLTKVRANNMPSDKEVERHQAARREMPPAVLIYKFSHDRASMLNNPRRKIHRPPYDRSPKRNFFMGD